MRAYTLEELEQREIEKEDVRKEILTKFKKLIKDQERYDILVDYKTIIENINYFVGIKNEMQRMEY